ncbi:hypothetical protein BASA81_003571 [Batrachochytrium salamandrivorans]|nr:hypothetical protein BASA81_003571 [Batrachochytrium salamandrivorans]
MNKSVRDALAHKRRVVEEEGGEGLAAKRAPAPPPLTPLEVAVLCSKHPHLLYEHVAYEASVCDVCRVAMLRHGDSAWRCPECDFDVCAKCLESNLVPNKLATPTNRKLPTGAAFIQIPDELFNAEFLRTKLHQRSEGKVSPATLAILNEHEIDFFLIRKLQARGLEQLGIVSEEELDLLLELADDEFQRAQHPTIKGKLPNELFSYVWFVSKLVQSKRVSKQTSTILGQNEVDLCLLRKLGDEGLGALGVSAQEERKQVLDFALQLESTL